MNADRIDFISSYCDRWCERCAFTMRCSAYACEVATAMCGDFSEGIELAVGRPCAVDGNAALCETAPDEEMFDASELSPQDQIEFDAREAVRDARVEASAPARLSRAYTLESLRWLRERYEALRAADDPVLVEACEVVIHDSAFIGAKVHRALDGRDRYRHDSESDHPIQNDWNGSAKVALISLRRSRMAWQVIAEATTDARTLDLARRTDELLNVVAAEFPDAMAFIRPGFDEPHR